MSWINKKPVWITRLSGWWIVFCLGADDKESQESLLKPVLFHSSVNNLQRNVLSTGLQVMPKLGEPLYTDWRNGTAGVSWKISNPVLKKEYVEQLYWRAFVGLGIQQDEDTDWYIALLIKSGLGAFTGRVTACGLRNKDCFLHYTLSRVLHPVLGPLIQGADKQKWAQWRPWSWWGTGVFVS